MCWMNLDPKPKFPLLGSRRALGKDICAKIGRDTCYIDTTA